jgi:hypothetical protein
MDSVIIITKSDFGLEQIRREIPSRYSVEIAANGRLVIERGERRAYLGQDVRIMDELEPEEASRILHMISEPTFYTLDFSDINFCKELLVAIVDRNDILIDNDHGMLLLGSEFVRILRNHMDWDWRCGDSS